MTFFKSEGKIEYEKSDANWLIKQCRDDMNQGKVLSDICEDAVQFVSEYNMMDLKIKYPNDVRNQNNCCQ